MDNNENVTSEAPASESAKQQARDEAVAKFADNNSKDSVSEQETQEEPKQVRYIYKGNIEDETAKRDTLDDDQINEVATKTSIKSGDAKKRRKLYKEDGVIVGFDGDTVDTSMSKKKSESDTLILAARSHPQRILDGVVQGITQTENNYPLVRVVINNSEGLIPIYIPASHFFVYPDDNNYNDPQNRHFLNDLRSRIGAKVRFVVFQYDENRQIAYASRLAAMEADGKHFYDMPQANGEPRVYPGQKCVVRIISTRQDRLVAECLGADVTIKSEELSWNSIGAVDREFAVGDNRVAVIKSVERFDYPVGNRVYHLHKVTASIREAEPDPREIYLDQFRVGDVYAGRVTQIVPQVGIFVNIDGKMDVLCDIPSGRAPYRDQRVKVYIREKDIVKKRLSGVLSY